MHSTPHQLKVTAQSFGMTPDGEAQLFTLTNVNGMELKVTNYGGIVTHLFVPDRDGDTADITLGFDQLLQYLDKHPNFGALIGRFGNRIAQGSFSLDGQSYTLKKNNGPNSLHGGPEGYSRRLWEATTIEGTERVGVQFSRLSPDMEEGFPGNLSLNVRYLLNNQNEWVIDYQATTDKKTVINLTQHTYFNLKGHDQGNILSHELTIFGNYITPVNPHMIPTGELMSVMQTPFDFRHPKLIGRDINDNHEQVKLGNGFDHNYVLNKNEGEEPQLAAQVFEPQSGRFMEVLTTEPGMQLYGGNFLDGSLRGKGGVVYQKNSGLCLETQHYPDSPNQPNFPSTELTPEDVYRSTTIYRFSTR